MRKLQALAIALTLAALVGLPANAHHAADHADANPACADVTGGTVAYDGQTATIEIDLRGAACLDGKIGYTAFVASGGADPASAQSSAFLGEGTHLTFSVPFTELDGEVWGWVETTRTSNALLLDAAPDAPDRVCAEAPIAIADCPGGAQGMR